MADLNNIQLGPGNGGGASIVNTPTPQGWIIRLGEGIHSTSQVSFEERSSRALLEVYVPKESVQEIPKYFLGAAAIERRSEDGSIPPLIRRTLPYQHPLWPWLWCTSINVKGLMMAPNNGPHFIGQGPAGRYDQYETYIVEAFFSHLNYAVRSDADVAGNEQLRWVEEPLPTPYNDVIHLEGGQLQFTDGPGAARPVLAEGINIRVAKLNLKLIWRQIPRDYIRNSFGIPTQLLASQGTVNSAPFRGIPAGQLLLDGVEDAGTTPAPVGPYEAGLTFPYDPPIYDNIALMFKFFPLGWNNLPFPGDGRWYEVAWRNNPSRKLYEESDFNAIFNAAVG
jgi:hypothetical protein